MKKHVILTGLFFAALSLFFVTGCADGLKASSSGSGSIIGYDDDDFDYYDDEYGEGDEDSWGSGTGGSSSSTGGYDALVAGKTYRCEAIVISGYTVAPSYYITFNSDYSFSTDIPTISQSSVEKWKISGSEVQIYTVYAGTKVASFTATNSDFSKLTYTDGTVYTRQ